MADMLLANYGGYLLLGMFLLAVVMVVLVTVLFFQMKKMKRRLNRFLGTGSEKHDMEVMLTGFLSRTEAVGQKYDRLQQQLDDAEDRLRLRLDNVEDRLGFCIQKTGMIRYNPFHDTGGDLSFALALLDEHHNGIIISSIYGRESCYTYGKTVSAGRPSHPFSPEEQQAFELATRE